ncbi:hypothetical protein MJ579_13180 [Klebsiella pneumoniae]|nr:hypothetical protein MJ579_13180 [Klebsiella pneumoniae]
MIALDIERGRPSRFLHTVVTAALLGAQPSGNRSAQGGDVGAGKHLFDHQKPCAVKLIGCHCAIIVFLFPFRWLSQRNASLRRLDPRVFAAIACGVSSRTPRPFSISTIRGGDRFEGEFSRG